MGMPKTTLEKLGPHVLSEVYCLVVSQLLAKGAIDSLPKYVPKVYANRGLTFGLMFEKMEILSPCLCKFIQAENSFLRLMVGGLVQ